MRKKPAGTASKEDLFVKLTVIQLVFALLTGGIFFGAYKLNAGFFGELKEGFAALMAEDMAPDGQPPYNFLRETTVQPPAEEKTEEDGAENEEDIPDVEEESAAAGAGGEDSPLPVSEEAADEAAVEELQAVMPVNGTYSSYFGARIHPVYGTEGFHSGIDIAAPEGEQVLAALDGTVSACGVGEMSGNYVKLDNGGGVETLYCHLSGILVSEGQEVKRGDPIALVGQTGLATGPHLHFELHINGVKCDPAPLLQNAVSVS